MAILPSNHVLNGLSGKIGKELVFKSRGEKTFISKYPDMSKVKPSVRQKQSRELFGKASAEAARISRNQEKRKEHQKSKSRSSLYHSIIRELLKSKGA